VSPIFTEADDVVTLEQKVREAEQVIAV